MSGCKKGNGTGVLTLTKVKIEIAYPKTTLNGVISAVFLAAVRVSITAFNAAVVIELESWLGVASPIVQGSKTVMAGSCEGQSRRRAGVT